MTTEIKFGTDGWRGVIAEDFTHANVMKVAHAIARYVVRAEKPGAGVLIGHDTRFGSEAFARTAAEAVSATGTPVWIATDACPTPALSLLVRLRGAAGGIQITASHNPYRWSGVKFKASYGSSASPAIVAQIESELAKALRDGVPTLPPRADLIHSMDVRAPYLETLAGLVDWERLRAAKFRFLIDPMHGAGRGLLRDLFRRHGIECEEIRGTRDPLFGGVNPEPIEPHVEALRVAMRGGSYDAGFVFDGDADRIGAMDRDGTFITPHQIFFDFAVAPCRHAEVGRRRGENILNYEDDRQDHREIRTQTVGDADRVQIHLRQDAGGRHSAGWRRKRRHRDEAASA